ncbi:MAG TPA: UDP-N-acetyl-D-mannosamine dehydrogenase [Mycobacteriales bacterium]
MNTFDRIAVIGLGYIGLPTAAALATNGLDVVGVDVNTRTVESVNRGEVPFVEPDLGVAVSGAVKLGRLKASTEAPEADVFIVAVPTPFQEGHKADLSYIRAATEAIAPKLRGSELVILESTSPPGTTEQMADWVRELRPDLPVAGHTADGTGVAFAHCPERVLPGRVMVELVTNDRIIGGLTPGAAERAADLYRAFCQGEMIITDAATAELSKLVENSYRDVNIAFANELSTICDELGIDVWELIRMANHHPRVNILQPGPGVGGHCIAVDPWFIVSAAPEQARLIRAAREINDAKPHHVVAQVLGKARELGSPRIACLGLAFKPNIDDLRESPALEIVELLSEALPDLTLDAVEPHVDKLPERLASRPNVVLTPAAEAVEAADIVVLLVDHDAFRELDRGMLAGKALVDTRGFWR